MDLDILRPLTKAEVFELLRLYRERYDSSNFHYLLLYNQCKWIEQLRLNDDHADTNAAIEWQRPFRKTFYTSRLGDFRTHGTYVSLHFDTMQSVSCHSWQDTGDELFKCLEETELIDWNGSPLFTNVSLEFCERLKELAVQKGVAVERARRCCLLVLSHDQAVKIQVPKLADEYYMAPIDGDKHAELIHTMWTNKTEGSLQYVKSMTSVNKTMAIYRTDNNEMIAWVIQNDFSGLGFLQVLPDYQRFGLGHILACALSKEIAQHEMVDVSAWIVVENYKSQGLLEKSGFTASQWGEWIQLRKL